MVIKVEELKILLENILHKLEFDNIDTISLDTDNYQIISTNEWDNFSNEIQPGIGSLIDDWENLKKTLDTKVPFTYVDFDRMASILRAISQKQNPI